MWLPPSWVIQAALSGAGHNAMRSGIPGVQGNTTKVVSCENCQRRYTYELDRIGANAEHLRQLLATGIEAIPCPACGWYQSYMIPEARKQHLRWMLNMGQCLTIGLIPVAVICTSINATYADKNTAPIPWPIFAAGAANLVGLLAVGIGMFIWRHRLVKNYNPNDEDLEAHKLYGQSRAVLLSEQEAKDTPALLGTPNRTEIASSTFLGVVPPFSDGQPAPGPKPEAQVLRFLTDLPRE